MHRYLVVALIAVVMAACGNPPAAASDPEFSDTWTWDGSDWTAAPSVNSPSPRSDPSIVFDATTRQVVLFGGRKQNSNDFMNDTWTWDGRAWTLRHPKLSPEARSNAAMVYNPDLKAVVLVGGFTIKAQPDGYTFIGDLDDEWTWDGTGWTAYGHMPQRLAFHGDGALGYDPTSKQLVAVTNNASWTGNGASWQKHEGPKGWRGLNTIYVDKTSGHLAGIGSISPGDGSLNYHIFSWGTGKWTMGPTIPLPTAEGFLNVAGLAYDQKHSQTLAFGGGCFHHPTSETWTFDGSTWTHVTPTHLPPPRHKTYMVFDSDHGVVVLFGGGPYSFVSCPR